MEEHSVGFWLALPARQLDPPSGRRAGAEHLLSLKVWLILVGVGLKKAECTKIQVFLRQKSVWEFKRIVGWRLGRKDCGFFNRLPGFSSEFRSIEMQTGGSQSEEESNGETSGCLSGKASGDAAISAAATWLGTSWVLNASFDGVAFPEDSLKRIKSYVPKSLNIGWRNGWLTLFLVKHYLFLSSWAQNHGRIKKFSFELQMEQVAVTVASLLLL